MPNLAKLGDVYITIVEEETYTYDSDVTDNPMEDGSYMSDNMHVKPIEGKLTGIICNRKGTYPLDQVETLRNYINNQIILNYSGICYLPNCVLQNMENVHNAETGGGFTFTFTIKQVFIAEKVSVSVGVDSLSIPDIQALKDQLQADEAAQKAAAKKAANAKVNGMVTKGRTAKKAATSTKKTTSKKKGSKGSSVLQDIIDMYG